MINSLKNKLFVLVALLALLVGTLGIVPAFAATTFLDESPALPDGFISGDLRGVWGSSAGDIFAVGGGEAVEYYYPLLYRNEGSGWTAERLTLPQGLTNAGMSGVWGSGAGDIYAVGWGDDNMNQRPLVYHNDGSGWTGTSLPLPIGWSWGGLSKVWGSSASDIYAVGNGAGPLAYHNDGNGWTPISLTSSGTLYDVWGSSASDVYMVGGNGSFPRVYHNDGNGWTEASLALPDGWSLGYLYRIWGSSANDVYAVGTGYDSNWNEVPLLYHNDGNGWTEDSPAQPDGVTDVILRGVWGSSASDVYVVGFSLYNRQSVLYHNDGSGWTDVSSALPNVQGPLEGVWSSSSGDVYLMGGHDNETPLIYHNGASQGTLPTVSTDSIETLSNRRVNATLSDLGSPASVTAHGVVYNTTGTPTTSDSVVDKGDTTTTGAYTVGLDEMNLTSGTKYYVRAFATNATGTSYGDPLVVYGVPGAFTIIAPTNNATDVSTSPTLSWNASTGATDYEYCVQPLLTDCTSNMFGPNWHSTGGATSVNLSGLLSGTTYQWAVRAVVGTPDSSYKWATNAPSAFTTAASVSANRLILLANGSQDGWILESRETSEIGGMVDSNSTVLLVGDDAYDRQYRSVLSFDTSGLPDTAVITQAVLSFRINEIVGGGNPIKALNYFMADVTSGWFGSTSSLAAQDFGFSTTLTSGPLNALNKNNWYYLDLKTGKAAINTTGLTQVRLRFSLGDNDNGIANIIKIYSGNSAIKPQLSLWYTVP